MNINFSHNSRRVYQIVVSIWSLLLLAVVLQIIAFDIQRAKAAFNEFANMLFQQANERVQINHTVLEGFAAMISTSNDPHRTRTRIYAQQMLKQYPHIFKFEIVEKVPHDRLDAFADYYRRHFYPDFRLKSFSYKSDRKWGVIENVPYHLPIVFMEPETEDSREVLGLDIGSNEFFRRSFDASEQQGRVVSTDPFTLVQGHLAYLLLKPVTDAVASDLSYPGPSGAQARFAELVIRADSLLNSDADTLPDILVVLFNSRFARDDPAGQLYSHEAPAAGRLESLIFPRLSVSKKLDSESQRFILHVEQQLGWRILSWWKLALALAVAIISFSVMLVYARLFYRNELERSERADRLFHLANHDSLTGLANRNLLMDRLGHAIAQSSRQKKLLAVLFLDLECFKAVNDSYGHDAGDGLLRLVAERLRACVRAGDTIARLGGDEFIVVLENIEDRSDVDHVVEKIRNGFEQSFSVDGHSITLGISAGVAYYPQDAASVEALIRHADSRMYQDKRGRNGGPASTM